MRVFGRQVRLPWSPKNLDTTLSNPAEWLVRQLMGRMTAAGVTVTPLRALGIATVYACVNVKSRTMSTLPIKVMKYLPGGGLAPAPEHPLNILLSDEPNDDMTSAAFIRAVHANATLRKAGYALIVRDGLGDVVELVPIAPCDICEEQAKEGGPVIYRLNGKIVDKKSLIRITGMTFDGVLGVDTMQIGKECIGLAIALQDNAARFFGNGSRPGGVLEHPLTLSPEAQDRLRDQVENKLKGPENAWGLLILEEGLKYAAQRTDNDSSQFNESRIYQDKAIARHFCIPQHKVGILDNAHYNNVEQENISYVQDAVLPDVRQWEQELTRKLIPREQRGLYTIKVFLQGLLRGDIVSRYEAYAAGRQWGWLCADDVRELEDMNPLPEGKGKIYLQPSNMVPAGTTPEELKGLSQDPTPPKDKKAKPPVTNLVPTE